MLNVNCGVKFIKNSLKLKPDLLLPFVGLDLGSKVNLVKKMSLFHLC